MLNDKSLTTVRLQCYYGQLIHLKDVQQPKANCYFLLSKKSVIAIFDIRIKLPTFCVQQSLLLSIVGTFNYNASIINLYV
jgi:hypothetical protein